MSSQPQPPPPPPPSLSLPSLVSSPAALASTSVSSPALAPPPPSIATTMAEASSSTTPTPTPSSIPTISTAAAHSFSFAATSFPFSASVGARVGESEAAKLIEAAAASGISLSRGGPIGGLNGPHTYLYAKEDFNLVGRTPGYRLHIRQQPLRARLCSFKEKVDRRPVDPPPVLQVTSINGRDHEIGQNSHLFLHAFLVNPETLAEIKTEAGTRCTAGTVIQNPYKMRDMDGRPAVYFAFPDLSLRIEGVYKLKFVLYEMVEEGVVAVATVFTESLTVMNPKLFPGMSESTPLTKHIAEQGFKLRVRKKNRATTTRQKRAAPSISSSEEPSHDVPPKAPRMSSGGEGYPGPSELSSYDHPHSRRGSAGGPQPPDRQYFDPRGPGSPGSGPPIAGPSRFGMEVPDSYRHHPHLPPPHSHSHSHSQPYPGGPHPLSSRHWQPPPHPQSILERGPPVSATRSSALEDDLGFREFERGGPRRDSLPWEHREIYREHHHREYSPLPPGAGPVGGYPQPQHPHSGPSSHSRGGSPPGPSGPSRDPPAFERQGPPPHHSHPRAGPLNLAPFPQSAPASLSLPTPLSPSVTAGPLSAGSVSGPAPPWQDPYTPQRGGGGSDQPRPPWSMPKMNDTLARTPRSNPDHHQSPSAAASVSPVSRRPSSTHDSPPRARHPPQSIAPPARGFSVASGLPMIQEGIPTDHREIRPLPRRDYFTLPGQARIPRDPLPPRRDSAPGSYDRHPSRSGDDEDNTLDSVSHHSRHEQPSVPEMQRRRFSEGSVRPRFDDRDFPHWRSEEFESERIRAAGIPRPTSSPHENSSYSSTSYRDQPPGVLGPIPRPYSAGEPLPSNHPPHHRPPERGGSDVPSNQTHSVRPVSGTAPEPGFLAMPTPLTSQPSSSKEDSYFAAQDPEVPRSPPPPGWLAQHQSRRPPQPPGHLERGGWDRSRF